MRNLNSLLMDAVANDGDKQSAVIDCQQVYALSVVATFTDGSAAGTIKLQGSNDVPAKQTSPPTFAPTNWVDIPSASASVTAGGSHIVEKNPQTFRWVRVAWVRSAGGGTFTVNLNTQGV